MSELQDRATMSTPRHLWVVGIIALLWNAIGVYDYLMTETKNESYISQFTPEQLEFFSGFPTWLVAAWAIAVWGGLLGAVMLLLRKRCAAQIFLVALIAMVVVTIQNYIISNGLEVMGGVGPVVFTGLIFVISVFLFLYARAMGQRGVLT